MNGIEQGTIVYGMRSEKYPEIVNYGVIISARCDIANDKISKLYYLNAVNARDWFCTTNGFSIAFDEIIKSKIGSFKSNTSMYKLNAELLLAMRRDEVERIITTYEKTEKRIKQFMNGFDAVCEFTNPNMSWEGRKKVIQKERGQVVKFLDGITRGTINHYFFLPKIAYSKIERMDDGLIVDLQEIETMSLEDAKRIFTPGIDNKLLGDMEKEEQERLNRKYWLQNDGFVAVEGTVCSPWCELMMQRFSNDFIRIGVDGPCKADFNELSQNI